MIESEMMGIARKKEFKTALQGRHPGEGGFRIFYFVKFRNDNASLLQKLQSNFCHSREGGNRALDREQKSEPINNPLEEDVLIMNAGKTSPSPVLWRFDSPPDCPAKFSAGLTKYLKIFCKNHSAGMTKFFQKFILVALFVLSVLPTHARVCLRNPSPFATSTEFQALQTAHSTLQTSHTALQERLTALESEMFVSRWLNAWRGHSGTLPSSSQVGAANSTTWSVTANVGAFGSQTVNGQAACTAGSAPTSATLNGTSCWCRMSGPFAGSWVFAWSYTASFCAHSCASNCAYCVRNGSVNSCTRGAVLG